MYCLRSWVRSSGTISNSYRWHRTVKKFINETTYLDLAIITSIWNHDIGLGVVSLSAAWTSARGKVAALSSPFTSLSFAPVLPSRFPGICSPTPPPPLPAIALSVSQSLP